MLSQHQTLSGAVKTLYPSNAVSLQRGEVVLRQAVYQLFGTQQPTTQQSTTQQLQNQQIQILYNTRKESGIITKISDEGKFTNYKELDIWIPQLNLGFEYQVSFLFFFLDFYRGFVF